MALATKIVRNLSPQRSVCDCAISISAGYMTWFQGASVRFGESQIHTIYIASCFKIMHCSIFTQ